MAGQGLCCQLRQFSAVAPLACHRPTAERHGGRERECNEHKQEADRWRAGGDRTHGRSAGLVIGAGIAHADSWGGSEGDFLDHAHGDGTGNVLAVPGGDAELVSLANVACTTIQNQGFSAAIDAVRAAEPKLTFAKKNP